MTNHLNPVEHRVETGQGTVYVREAPGAEPAFVLMHGFPDNLGIYDTLVPHLTAAGRRSVAFDFPGFGRSERRPGATYTFADQLETLEAVVADLGLRQIVPVAHDSSGPTAINFALRSPERVAALVILNSAYDDAFPILWPEMITLFATGSLGALAGAVAQNPEQFGWLLDWQKTKFSNSQPVAQREGFEAGIGQLIAENFIRQPSSGPAFMQLASHFFEELARNSTRLTELKRIDVPVKVIWGEFDPYFTADVARHRASQFKNASLRLLPAGHWLQADVPEIVAKEMLA